MRGDLACAHAALYCRGGMACAPFAGAGGQRGICAPATVSRCALGMAQRPARRALEVERAQKRIGSSLEAAPLVYMTDPELFAALLDVDLAEVSITSAATLVEGEGPADAFRLPEVAGVAVQVALAQGKKCARSWKISESVGSDPAYPDVSLRDAQALREW